nr:hypothetical protein [Streptomyces sp. SID5643]
MGAILVDRVLVGAGSLVAAGALITEGTGVPPGSLAARRAGQGSPPPAGYRRTSRAAQRRRPCPAPRGSTLR